MIIVSAERAPGGNVTLSPVGAVIVPPAGPMVRETVAMASEAGGRPDSVGCAVGDAGAVDAPMATRPALPPAAPAAAPGLPNTGSGPPPPARAVLVASALLLGVAGLATLGVGIRRRAR